MKNKLNVAHKTKTATLAARLPGLGTLLTDILLNKSQK